MTTLLVPATGDVRPFACVTAEGTILVLAETGHDATRAVPVEFGWVAATIDLHATGQNFASFADL